METYWDGEGLDFKVFDGDSIVGRRKIIRRCIYFRMVVVLLFGFVFGFFFIWGFWVGIVFI